MSALCSLLSHLHTTSEPPINCKGRTRSTSWKSHSSQTSSIYFIHSTIGRSAVIPLNSGISRMSNCLLLIVSCWNILSRIIKKKVYQHQHKKSVLPSLSSLSNPPSCFFQILFCNVLLKQKFVILCRAENSLMQNMGHLHEWNFGTAQPSLQPNVYAGHPLLNRQHTKCVSLTDEDSNYLQMVTSGSLCLLLPLHQS